MEQYTGNYGGKQMNLQDFACAVSDLVWGGELGWDKENGLEELFDAVKRQVTSPGHRYEDLTLAFKDTIDSIEESLRRLKGEK